MSFLFSLATFCSLQALQSIAELRCLQQLVLADCSAVTTGGLEQLSGLVGLHHLALLRCPRVGDQGMTLLRCLTRLTHLALTGCSKVPSQLTVLLVHPSTSRTSIQPFHEDTTQLLEAGSVLTILVNFR